VTRPPTLKVWRDHAIDGSGNRAKLTMTAFMLTFRLVPDIMEVV